MKTLLATVLLSLALLGSVLAAPHRMLPLVRADLVESHPVTAGAVALVLRAARP